MVRDITFSISDIDRIYVDSSTFTGYYAGKRLYAGQAGENEATRLRFRFGEKFDGYTVRIYINDAEATSYIISEGDREFSYDISEDNMVPEVIKMAAAAEKDGQTVKTRPVYLEVKRDA